MAAQGKEHQYGRRLMPCVLDHLSRTVPGRLFAAVPKTGDLADGFRDISVSEISRCVDFMASWLTDRFGRGNDFETLAYVGIPDLRGVIIFYAAVKCGYKLLVPSPRNPPTTNLSLIEQTACTKLVHTVEVAPLIKPLVSLDPALVIEAIPSFDQMLSSNPAPYPYEKHFDDAENEPILVLHSSGSTGLPKPIVMTHGSFAVMDNEKNLEEIPGRKRRDWSMWNFEGESRVYTIFPFFHLGGFMAFAFNPVLNNAAPVLGPPFMIPDANLLRSVRSRYKLRSIILPPSIVEQILQEPDGTELFQDVDFLVTSGAPISPAVGDKLSQIVEIRQPFGVTEAFLIPELDPGREEWAYHEWNPNYKHEMQLYDPNEQTYELVVLAGESNKRTTAVYHNLPGVTEFHTKDLFTRHPKKPNLYKYYGRRDDIIVLANGHKLNPLPLEAALGGHPELKGAILVGNRRPHTVLLVEPSDAVGDVSSRNSLLERLWPFVEKANTLIAGQGRVQRGHVICAVPDKPFVRTGKGTVVRKLSEDLYKGQIEGLYEGSVVVEEQQAVSILLKPNNKSEYELSDVVQFLREVIALSFAPGATISEEDDFFGHGLDSMQTLAIVSNLRRHLQNAAPKEKEDVSWITPRTVFYNPSLTDLARVMHEFLNKGTIPQQTADDTTLWRTIDDTVRRHVDALPPPRAPCCCSGLPLADEKVSNVALIGSTGYVGAYLVAALLRTEGISRIYCLNRGADAQQRQEAALRQILGDEEPARSQLGKLVYMKATLGEPRLGLTEAQYDVLVNDGGGVDVVAFNAWKLDFGLALRSFEPFLRATRDAIELALAVAGTNNKNRKTMPRFLFVSSLSSVGNLHAAPEEPVHEARAPLRFGYAQSKHVAERILAAASERCGLPVSIVRVGQVGGSIRSIKTGKSSNSNNSSSTGSGKDSNSTDLVEAGNGRQGEGGEERGGGASIPWPEQRWISALLRTAKTTGCMPSHVALVDWIPVESVAATLRSLMLLLPPRTIACDAASEQGQIQGAGAGAKSAVAKAEAFHLYPSSKKPLPRWDVVVDHMRRVHGVTQVIPLPAWTRTLRDNNMPATSRRPEDEVVETMPALKMLDFYEASGDGLEGVEVVTDRCVAVSGVEIRPVDAELVSAWLSEWNL